MKETKYTPSRQEITARAKFKDVIQYDENGEIVYQTTTTVKSRNGGGFVLSYTAKVGKFLEEVKTGSVVRVFMYLAHHQSYGYDGVYGFRTSRGYLSKVLGLDPKSVYTALEWLKDKFLVNELRINGALEYMVNPDYVTVGTDPKARKREWSERWKFYWQHVADKKHNKLDDVDDVAE